jgi:hypothetical protein
MRYFFAGAGVVIVGLIAAVYLGWGSIANIASEGASAGGRELGRVSYHAARCGEAGLTARFQTSMDQIDKMAEDFQADMKTAFKAGVAEARNMKVEYTATFCAGIGETFNSTQG